MAGMIAEVSKEQLERILKGENPEDVIEGLKEHIEEQKAKSKEEFDKRMQAALDLGPLKGEELALIMGLLIDIDDLLQVENLRHGIPQCIFRKLMMRVGALADKAMDEIKEKNPEQEIEDIIAKYGKENLGSKEETQE